MPSVLSFSHFILQDPEAHHGSDRTFLKSTAVGGRAAEKGQGRSDPDGLTPGDSPVTSLLDRASPPEDLGAPGEDGHDCALREHRQRTHRTGLSLPVLSTSRARAAMNGNQLYS